MMKAVQVAQKTLRELVREPMLLGLMLFFPIILVVFYFDNVRFKVMLLG